MSESTETTEKAEATGARQEGSQENPTEHHGRLWTGGLLLLSSVLQAAARQEPGKWMWRRLEDGTRVLCRLPQGTDRLEMLVLPLSPRPEHERRQQERFLGLTGWAGRAVTTTRGNGFRYSEPDPPAAPVFTRPVKARPIDSQREAQIERAQGATGR